MSVSTCPKCGAALPDATKFCQSCGAQAAPPAPEPVIAAVQAPPPAPKPKRKEKGNETTHAAHTPIPDKKPVGAVGYFFILLLFSIPIVGIVLAFLWAFGKKTPFTRKAIAQAQLVLWAVIYVGALIIYILNFSVLNEFIKFTLR